MNTKQDSYFVNYGDFRMPDWLLKTGISRGAKLTYSVLACCAGGKDHAWPSQEYLAAKISASVRSVQRYIKELTVYGLIKKVRQQVKGQMRCVYHFLLHKVIGSSSKSPAQKPAVSQIKKSPITSAPQYDKLSCRSVETEKNLTTDTTNCQKQYDKLSSSLNKDETIKRNIYPPTPQSKISEPELPTESLGGGEIFLSDIQEDSRWTEAKISLAEHFSENIILTWVSPLIFESATNGTAILRAPNDFFKNWVSKNYGTTLANALKAVGIDSWNIELQTKEQLDALETARATEALKTVLSTTQPVQTEEDIEALSPDEKFDRLFEIYPVKKVEADSRRIFLNLNRRGKLPELKTLIKSVKDHLNHDRWWREKMPPLLTNWLLQNKWRDRPYG